MAFANVTHLSSFSHFGATKKALTPGAPVSPCKRVFTTSPIVSCARLNRTSQNASPCSSEQNINPRSKNFGTLPVENMHGKKHLNFQSEWDDVAFVLSSQEADIILKLLKDAPNRRTVGAFQPELTGNFVNTGERSAIVIDGVSVELCSKHISITLSSEKQFAEILGVDVSKATLEYLASHDGAWLIFPDGSHCRAARHGKYASVSLRPVPDSIPTMIIGGFGMHRFARNVRPCEDTANKVRAMKPRGKVLDICTGLGYTAIASAAMPNVTSVLTIEKDEAVLEMTRINPWSRALYTIPSIEVKLGDAIEILAHLPKDTKFDTICHDPPALAFAGDLYSGAFYTQLRRLLSRNGRLFHYIGNPNSEESGRLFKGVKKRLLEAGFAHVEYVEDAFGVVAVLQIPTTRPMQKSNRRGNRARCNKG